MDYMRTNLTFPTTSREPSPNTREFCTAKGTTLKNFLMKLWKRLCLNLFSQGEGKCLADLMTSCCMVNWGLTFSQLLNCYIQFLFRARPNFYMISDSPNVSLGNVESSLYTRRIALKGDYHKKLKDMLAYTPVKFNYLQTLAKTFIIPARQNQFFQENISNNDTVRRIAIAMNTNPAFTEFYTENTLGYKQFELRQTRILRRRQPIVDFDAADNCRLFDTTMKAMNFRDDIPSIPIDNLKAHQVLVFELTSMEDATENCHYPELIGEPLRLELNFAFPLELVTELIVLGERMSVAVDKFGVVGKNI